jgi:hypothetical protein
MLFFDWSFWLGLSGLVASVLGYIFPPVGIAQRAVHAVYLSLFACVCFVSIYVVGGRDAQITLLNAEIATRNQLSSQASRVAATLVVTDSTCRAVVIAGYAFLETWKMQIPQTFEALKKPFERAINPLFDEAQAGLRQDKECLNDATAIRTTIESLGAAARK